jgi:glycosyltransferase involved in cell wall biosynthesis
LPAYECSACRGAPDRRDLPRSSPPTVRILFPAHQFFPDHRAGVEIVTLGLARELKSRGHEPYVFAAKRSIPGSGIEPYETQDYEFEGIPVRRVGRPEEGLSRPYRLNYQNDDMAQKAREYMRGIEPDIVHVMHLQGLSASVLPAFKESGVPLVFTAADFWTICPVVDLRRHDGALCTGPEVTHCVRCIASRNPDPRVRNTVASISGPVLKVADGLSRTPLPRFSHSLRQIGAVRERPAYIRTKLELVDRVVAYTQLTQDLLLRNGIGAGKTMVSHYGIDTSGLAEAAERRRPSPTLRVGFVGTLAPHKGCDILVRAFNMLPPHLDATLSVHGDPDRYPSFADELRELAADEGRISFRGAFSRDELGRVMSELDVLAVPSRWYENAPGVIFEAFAAGMPIVATNLKGMSEFVKHGENGLLFELENAGDLSRQLRRLGEEPGLLDTLRAGISPVKTVAEYADEMEELYVSLSRQA